MEQFDLFHVFRLKKVGVFLGQLAAKAADAAVQVPLHQRLKGGKVAPLDGVQQVAVVGWLLCWKCKIAELYEKRFGIMS